MVAGVGWSRGGRVLSGAGGGEAVSGEGDDDDEERRRSAVEMSKVGHTHKKINKTINGMYVKDKEEREGGRGSQVLSFFLFFL